MTEARKTALVVGSVLIALGGWSLWRQHPQRGAILASAGALLLLLGVLVPRWVVPFHIAWMKLAAALGYINSRIILGFMYYGIFTPLGWVMKLGGRDPLNRRRAPVGSYWVPRAKTRQDKQQFERLF